jgi:hypothetical protein
MIVDRHGIAGARYRTALTSGSTSAGSGTATPTIDDWQRGRLLTAIGTLTNNGTKGNPSLVADILGDWPEEPSHTSFYLGSDIDWSKVPVPAGAGTRRPAR